jgi:membrane protease subunit HflC
MPPVNRRRAALSVLFLLALAAVTAWACAVIVDETQYVVVTSFGRPVALYGDDPGESGLHLKWPWQSSHAIDRRVRVSDLPAREVITQDKKNLETAAYVAWRVADPARFLRAAGTHESAAARLEERIAAALSDAVGTRPLDALASTDATVWKLDELTDAVRDDVSSPALRELGVEVLDVRLRRFNHPVEVRSAVFDLIRSERRRVAASLRAEGEAKYRTLTSQAERERDRILAEADAEAERIRGRGEAEATRLLNAAHARDPKFYEFLRTLETYRALLDDQATVVLSATSPLLRLLTQGPPEELMRDAPKPPESSEALPTPVAGSAGSP